MLTYWLNESLQICIIFLYKLYDGSQLMNNYKLNLHQFRYSKFCENYI